MPPSAQANLYATQADVEDLLSAFGVAARLDDDASGAVEDDEAGRMAKALNYATARVKMYCLPRYDDADLASSWLVNDWATSLAALKLCSRRLQPVPDSLRELVFGAGGPDRGVMGELEDVKAGRTQIPDVGTRNVDWPAWSNMGTDARCRVRQSRVQPQTSENTPTQYPQATDRRAEYPEY